MDVPQNESATQRTPPRALRARSDAKPPHGLDPLVALGPQIAGLLGSCYPSLLRRVYRRTGCQELAADLVNDAIVIFLERIRAGKLVDLDTRLISYLLGVAVNLLRNHRRHSANRQDIRAHPNALDTCIAPAPRDEADDERTELLIHQLLEPLSARNQELVRRFYLEEEDKDSISELLKIPMPQLTLRLWRARQQMRQRLVHKEWNPQDLL